MLGGCLGSQCFGWWHTVGRRPPPSLASPLGWIKIAKRNTLILTQLCLTVIDPAWQSPLCDNCWSLIAFSITSALLSSQVLFGLSWRVLQPSTRFLEHTLKKKDAVDWLFPGCPGPWLLEQRANPNTALTGVSYPLLKHLQCWGITRLVEPEICLPRKVPGHLLSSTEVNLISLSSPAWGKIMLEIFCCP